MPAKFPRVTTTLGAISSSWASRNGRHASISSGCGSRLFGRPALHDVGDVDAVAGEAHLLGHEPVEELAGAAHEGQALLVLLGTRALADEHQVGGGVAHAEHDVRAARRQRATGAGGGVVGDDGEGGGHRQRLPPGPPPTVRRGPQLPVFFGRRASIQCMRASSLRVWM